MRLDPMARRSGVVGILVVLLTLLFPTLALAHERRTVGSDTFLVGFQNEPAIQGEPNSLDLTITDGNGQAVTGAEQTLKVGIAYGGGSPQNLPLIPSDETPGLYNAAVIPTKAGTYAFVITGTLNGTSINERFESGPNTFSDVVAPSTLDFPVAVPAPQDLAQQAQAANDAAQAANQRATLLGFGGIGLGLVGIILALIALVLRPRSALPLEAQPDEVTKTPAGTSSL